MAKKVFGSATVFRIEEATATKLIEFLSDLVDKTRLLGELDDPLHIRLEDGAPQRPLVRLILQLKHLRGNSPPL